MFPKHTHRIEFIDFLKGFGIFCVLWGHSIHHLAGVVDFWENTVYKFIYSFHMPLFFIISGFFFNSSLKLNFSDFLRKKALQLLLPWFIWCILLGISQLINYDNGNLDFFLIIKNIFYSFRFWFIRELFISYFITYICYRIFKRKIFSYFFSVCFVLFAPLCYLQSFYLPFFIIGIILKDNYSFVFNHLNKILIISTIIFSLCLPFWGWWCYSTVPCLFSWKIFCFVFSNFNAAIFRFLIGFAGSLFFFTLFHKIYFENCLYSYINKIGRNTLGIYILL
jgi:fucose 4-O-acetylase-like acetyltransferase